MPTGVKIFNWLFTMYGGRVRFAVPVLWTIGFMVTFVLGGLTGVLLAVPPVDWQVHNSLFLVAHFHHVIIPGVVFGAFAGYIYWFPKAFGFKLDERWGRRAFWCWFIGFHLAFMPLYVVGLMGMTRRLQHYDVSPGSRGCWSPRPVLSSFSRGSSARSCSSSCRSAHREELRDVTGDPWNGRTLEWSTASPPPAWNFAVLPRVAERDAYWAQKQRARANAGQPTQAREYEPIEMPKNSSDRLRQRLLCRRHRLCPDLAHLVDGRCGPARRIRDVPRLRIPRRRRRSRYRLRRLPSSIALTRRRSRYERRCRHR